jgi:hypothetical protein
VSLPGSRGAAAALLAAAIAAAPGCTAAGARAALRAEIDAVAAARSRPAPSPFGLDAPGVVHCHTRVSHDSPAPLDEAIEAARRTGVRWICMTDHTTPLVGTEQPRGPIDGVLVVPGEEVSAWGGSVLALGARRTVAKRGQRFEEFGEEIRAQGAVPLLGHVTHFRGRPRAALDGMAVYDLSDDYRKMALRDAWAVLRCTASGDPAASAEAYLLLVQRRPRAHLDLWDGFLAAGPCAGVAETNAHAKFRYLGTTWDPFVGLFPLVRNHALVERLDEASVLDAVRRGRVAIGFDAAADATGARFEAWRGGAPAAAMGDAVPWDPALSLLVHLPVPAEVRVLRDGLPWREGRGRVLSFPPGGPGVYRAEADLRLGGARRPWVIFNPVRVTAAAP